MALHYVRWLAPGHAHPLRRDFHTKREREEFRARLPYLSEGGCYPKDKPPGWADKRLTARSR